MRFGVLFNIMHLSLPNTTFLYCADKTQPYPSKEGMHKHKARFSKMPFLNVESSIVRKQETKCSCKRPFAGGAKLKSLKLKRLGFLRMKERLTIMVSVESDDKNYRRYKSAQQTNHSSNDGCSYFINIINIINHKR